MKKLITKYWGVLLVVVLLSTLFVGAVPVANAGTLAWSTVTTPDNLGITNQIATAGTDAAKVTVAPNGDLFCIDANTVTTIYKSVNGGISWVPTVVAGAAFVDLAVSPSYATDSTVFALGNVGGAAQGYISSNAGISFSVLGGTVTAAYIGTSIAVAPNYNGGTGEIMIGTQQVGAGAVGDVFIWGRNGVLNWTAQGLAKDVTKVAFSPNFAIDMTRLAVCSVAGAAGTTLDTLVAADGGFNLTLTTVATVDATIKDTGTAPAIIGSSIAFPSDFNASSPFTRTCYVGTNSASAADNVWRLGVGSPVAAVALGPLTAFAIANQDTISLAYSGTSAAGTLVYGGVAPFVVATSTPTGAAAVVAASWLGSFAGPTGAANAYVALATDYATSHKIYCGTTGANSALSISVDGGLYFYQAGLIDTTVTSISDFAVADASTFFMATESAAAGANITSVWKTTNAGTTWFRYNSIAKGLAGAVVLRVSPNYATDSTVVLGIVNQTVAGAASNILVTNNGGTSWTGKTSPLAVNDIAVKDMYTFYVANAGPATTVQATANGGWTWQPVPTTVFAGGNAVTDIEIDLASGALLCGSAAGGVFVSLNNNVSWIPLGNIGGTNTTVAFDANYATNGITYAASRVGGTGDVKRFGTGYTAALSMGCAAPAGSIQDLLSTPDGTLYVTDNVAGAGMYRSINPTAGFAALSTARWDAVATSLAATATLTNLAASANNVIYAVDSSLGPDTWVRTYSDTLAPGSAAATPVPTSPADGAIFASPINVVLTWDAVPGALAYQIQYDTRADWATATIPAAIGWPLTSTVVGTPAAPLASGATYYWRVRVSAPVTGAWCAQQTFLTQLAPVAPNAPPFLGNGTATQGTTSPGGYDVALVPTFGWGSIGGATGYNFQLSMNPEMTELLVDEALPATTAYKLTGHTLKYSTSYYWRVQGFSATSTTSWSNVAAFTTMDEPVVTTPVETTQAPVITPIINLPAPIVNLPATTTVTKEINPTYIWAIIVIGAVLVLAVIVLIVRTRRSV